jgi:hypothetical protein
MVDRVDHVEQFPGAPIVAQSGKGRSVSRIPSLLNFTSILRGEFATLPPDHGDGNGPPFQPQDSFSLDLITLDIFSCVAAKPDA